MSDQDRSLVRKQSLLKETESSLVGPVGSSGANLSLLVNDSIGYIAAGSPPKDDMSVTHLVQSRSVACTSC
jgi:hypothetical protein